MGKSCTSKEIPFSVLNQASRVWRVGQKSDISSNSTQLGVAAQRSKSTGFDHEWS